MDTALASCGAGWSVDLKYSANPAAIKLQSPGAKEVQVLVASSNVPCRFAWAIFSGITQRLKY